jgi:glycerol-3-phosphate acyltransferase PlsY
MKLSVVVLSALIGYLLGCIQTAYIIGKKVKKIDIREYGSNNSGASNVTTVMGWKYGIITAAVDILKAAAAVIILRLIFPNTPYAFYFAGAFALIGHIFPFYMGFKGGKGTASLIGMVLAINYKIALIIIISLVILTIVTDFIAIGSLAMYVIMPIASYFFGYSTTCIIIAACLCVIGFFVHRINIKRLINKEEVGLRAVIQKNKASLND